MNTNEMNTQIAGKTLAEVEAMGIDFGSSYPIVENGVVTGTVDGNCPEDFNGGEWDIVDDSHAVAR